MVAVFNKELLSWYLITLKLRETVESGLLRSSTGTIKSLELPEDHEHHHLQIPITEDGENCSVGPFTGVRVDYIDQGKAGAGTPR
ncbi:hypothetical protein V6N12_055556 [Hibiscus sabdariffa]|uniref:Uncharacterized protein n=1 Tax=Hibiscus sabdariffa TaxID=183260 RepID=A0ABR2BU23_9ROSI